MKNVFLRRILPLTVWDKDLGTCQVIYVYTWNTNNSRDYKQHIPRMYLQVWNGLTQVIRAALDFEMPRG